MAIRSKVVMMTCRGREDAAAETLAAFADVGVPVDHVERQVEEPSLRMNGINYARALRAANGEDAFVIEDDLIPANTLGAWIEWVKAQGYKVPVFFYLCQQRWQSSDAARGMWDGGPDAPAGVEPVANLHTWWGTQAVWWPKEFTRGILSLDRFQWEAYELSAMDLELRNHLMDRVLTPLVTVPHLVQHRDYWRITGGSAPHKTAMFRPDATPPVDNPVVAPVDNPVDNPVENEGATLNQEPPPRKTRAKNKE
jgi:hypothetical protein